LELLQPLVKRLSLRQDTSRSNLSNFRVTSFERGPKATSAINPLFSFLACCNFAKKVVNQATSGICGSNLWVSLFRSCITSIPRLAWGIGEFL